MEIAIVSFLIYLRCCFFFLKAIWEEYYTRKFRAALEYGQQPHGRDDELCELGEEFIRKVIPRLLRPLQTGGRRIKPALCHGDLWDANVQIDASIGQPVLFDPCSFYGHNECQSLFLQPPSHER